MQNVPCRCRTSHGKSSHAPPQVQLPKSDEGWGASGSKKSRFEKIEAKTKSSIVTIQRTSAHCAHRCRPLLPLRCRFAEQIGAENNNYSPPKSIPNPGVTRKDELLTYLGKPRDLKLTTIKFYEQLQIIHSLISESKEPPERHRRSLSVATQGAVSSAPVLL